MCMNIGHVPSAGIDRIGLGFRYHYLRSNHLPFFSVTIIVIFIKPLPFGGLHGRSPFGVPIS